MRLLEKVEPAPVHSAKRGPMRDAPRGVAPAVAQARYRLALQRALALVLLVPALPLMAVTIAIVRVTSRGPGIYRQTRVGFGGRNFVMRKIRTMRVDAEARSGPVWAQLSDPRVTPVGRLIRTLHLDELPQLFNVLRGEMDLVGPRPERPEFTQWLGSEIPGYLNRLSVRPGITGLAQINLPPDTDLDSVRRKLALDLEYIHTRTLWLDARIVACTALRLFGVRSAAARRLLRLNRQPVVLTPEEHPYSPNDLVAETPQGMAYASVG